MSNSIHNLYPKNELIIQKAVLDDVPEIWTILSLAKVQMMREEKNQWNDEYPTPEHIIHDIQHDYAYKLCYEDCILAYGAVVYDGESAYNSLQGKWLSNQPYVVVHRLAVADFAKRQGIGTFFMQKIEDLSRDKDIHSFKIDTNYDNFYMLRILNILNFKYCGLIKYPQGNRWAYEKII